MHRQLTLLILFISSALTIQAQWDLGLWAGPSYAIGNQDASNGLVEYEEPKFTFSGGAYAEFTFDNDLVLETGLGFIERKIQYQEQITVLNLRIEDRLRHLTVPVIGRYYFLNGLSVLAGVQVDILLRAESRVLTGFGSGTSNQIVNTTEFVKSVSGNLTAGLELTGQQKSLGIRYFYGLTDINDPDTDAGKYKYHTIQAYLKARIGRF